MSKHLLNVENRNDWGTPNLIYDNMNKVFSFTLDAAASQHNTKCDNFLTEKDDALNPFTNWGNNQRVWLNPPYGQAGPGAWVKRVIKERNENDNLVVMLVKAATDTSWWHEAHVSAQTTLLLTPRVQFIPPPGVESKKKGNNHGSSIFIFRPSGMPDPMFKDQKTVMYNWEKGIVYL